MRFYKMIKVFCALQAHNEQFGNKRAAIHLLNSIFNLCFCMFRNVPSFLFFLCVYPTVCILALFAHFWHPLSYSILQGFETACKPVLLLLYLVAIYLVLASKPQVIFTVHQFSIEEYATIKCNKTKVTFGTSLEKLSVYLSMIILKFKLVVVAEWSMSQCFKIKQRLMLRSPVSSPCL